MRPSSDNGSDKDHPSHTHPAALTSLSHRELLSGSPSPNSYYPSSSHRWPSTSPTSPSPLVGRGAWRGSARVHHAATVHPCSRPCTWITMILAASVLLLLLSAMRLRGPGDGPPPVLHVKPVRLLIPDPLTDEQLEAALRARQPMRRLRCEDQRWAKEYAALHRAVLAGKAPQRYALFRSRSEWANGLADRVASSIGVLLFAILTDRAYQYDFEGQPQLWEGLPSEYIDWRYKGWDGAPNSSIVLDYVAEHNSEPEFISFFTDGNLTAIGEDKHTVTWYTDHAVVYGAFDNPHLRPRLEALGLRRESAFACLFDFLYRPTQEVLEVVKPQLPALLNPEAVKIGVQIRVGDWQLVSSHRYFFHPQDHPALFDHYFDCAMQIEHAVAREDAPVVWYLLVDMADLRARLAARHPDRVLVKSDVASIEHTVKSAEHSRDGFLMAVAELWAFSLTDWHVLTRKSGFGKVGAMVSASGPNHVFTIDFPMQLFNFLGLGGPAFDNRKVINLWQGRRSCHPADADDLAIVCSDFTGC